MSAENYESLQDHGKRIKELEKIVKTLANEIYHLEQKVHFEC